MIPARKGKVLCVGRTYCDLVFTGVPKIPAPGEEIYADSLEIHPGGGAFITAAYLATLGVGAALCSVLPTGPLGLDVLRQLKRTAIDLSNCETAPAGSEPQVTVAISMSDDRSFLTNRSGPALPTCTKQALNDPELVHLHIAELATLAENPDLANAAKARGITVSLDCSWDEALLSKPDTLHLIRNIDVFLPNEKEVRRLLGLKNPLGQHFAEISGLAPIVAVKQGAKGALLFANGATTPAAPLVATLVDSTGAGDAFNAGFVAAWLNGKSPPDCLNSGNRMGALAVQKIGGTGGIDQAVLLSRAV